MKLNNLTNLPVESSGHLYEHNIYLQRNFFEQGIYLKLYTNTNTSFTTQMLLDYLKTYGPITVNGIWSQSGSRAIIIYIYYYNDTNIGIHAAISNFTQDIHSIELNEYLTITDTIRQIF